MIWGLIGFCVGFAIMGLFASSGHDSTYQYGYEAGYTQAERDIGVFVESDTHEFDDLAGEG